VPAHCVRPPGGLLAVAEPPDAILRKGPIAYAFGRPDLAPSREKPLNSAFVASREAAMTRREKSEEWEAHAGFSRWPLKKFEVEEGEGAESGDSANWQARGLPHREDSSDHPSDLSLHRLLRCVEKPESRKNKRTTSQKPNHQLFPLATFALFCGYSTSSM
jgi:hypothetical protein